MRDTAPARRRTRVAGPLPPPVGARLEAQGGTSWEIWNEPNIFFWSGPKELYFTLLAKASDAIKAEDPEAQVLGCSTAGIDIDFIRRTIDSGAKFDPLTIHPYRGELNDLDFIKELRNVKALVGGRPVWITEMGWPSDRFHGCSERRQASYVARTYLTSVASGAVASVSWYDFRNDGTDPFYNEENFGLVRHVLTPKPGYVTLATIGRLLGRSRLVGRARPSPTPPPSAMPRQPTRRRPWHPPTTR